MTDYPPPLGQCQARWAEMAPERDLGGYRTDVRLGDVPRHYIIDALPVAPSPSSVSRYPLPDSALGARSRELLAVSSKRINGQRVAGNGRRETGNGAVNSP